MQKAKLLLEHYPLIFYIALHQNDFSTMIIRAPPSGSFPPSPCCARRRWRSPSSPPSPPPPPARHRSPLHLHLVTHHIDSRDAVIDKG